MITLKYFGKSAFKISSKSQSIIINPGCIENKNLVSDKTEADIICVSNTDEENFGNTVKLSKKQKAMIIGNDEVIDKAEKEGAQAWRIRKVKDSQVFDLPGITITPYSLAHGPANATKVPMNSGFVIKIGEIIFAHTGTAIGVDRLTRQEIHVLLIPVGGNVSFDSKTALQAMGQISPKLAIPIAESKEEDSQYFLQHHKYFAPNSEVMVLKPNEEISIEWIVGSEFKFNKK